MQIMFFDSIIKERNETHARPQGTHAARRGGNRQLGIMMVKLGGHLMMRIIGGILDIREIL